jgi:hypothetical protein
MFIGSSSNQEVELYAKTAASIQTCSNMSTKRNATSTSTTSAPAAALSSSPRRAATAFLDAPCDLLRILNVALRMVLFLERIEHPMHAPQERYLLVTFTDQLSPSAAECAECRRPDAVRNYSPAAAL